MNANLVIRVKPFLKGQSKGGHTILRTVDAPNYLSVSEAEMKVLEELRDHSLSLDSYIRWHLPGTDGLSFREAVQLLTRLSHANFLDEHQNVETAVEINAADTDLHRWHRHASNAWRSITRVLDVELLRTVSHSSQLHPLVRYTGQCLLSVPVLGALSLGTLALIGGTSAPFQSNAEAVKNLLNQPGTLIAANIAALWISNMVLALMQLFVLAGVEADLLVGSFRLSAFSIFRLSWLDEDVLILPRSRIARYFTVRLLMPWFLGAALSWAIPSPAAKILALSFYACGLASLCPLFRSPVIKFAEGWFAMLNILGLTKQYLYRHLFGSVLSKKRVRYELLMASFATLTLLWLYALSIVFSDALALTLPVSLAIIHSSDPLKTKVAACLLVILLGIGVTLTLARLMMVIFQNVASVTALPLRKARKNWPGVGATHTKPSETLSAFLSTVPIFNHLSEIQILNLSHRLIERRYRAGQPIIRAGESGDEFFILAAGEAHVIDEHNDGTESLLGILKPGDSFGEIALIEKTPRSASVRAARPTTMFVLDRQEFDSLFPEHSDERRYLTLIIRRVKLVLESQALSHLSPTQIRELLRCSDRVEFSAGASIIRAGDPGDAVYLIESGRAKVVSADEKLPLGWLSPGDLAGVIAVIKGIKRTASVIADSDVSCLKIDRGIFLSICMSNINVAILASELSEHQLKRKQAA